MNIPPGKPLKVLLQNWSDNDKSHFKQSHSYIYSLAKIENIKWLEDESTPKSATALVGEMKILIPLAGLIDKEAESARLEKEIKKLESNLEKSSTKLNNPNFADKAPIDVVNKERERVAEMQISLQQLKEQADKINNL
jgi:valyl-tRNA synthetase